MNEHKYILEPYKGMNTRYHCPQCQQRDKTFTRYINTATGEHLADHVGRCNRESSCGYHYTPKQYFQDNNISFDKNYNVSVSISLKSRKQKAQPKPVSYIPLDKFKSSLQGHKANNFITYIIKLFGTEKASQLISKYFIGTSKHWQGATIFYQIDIKGGVRTGKIMLYDAANCKRVKEPYNHIHWVHKAIEQPEFNLQQCFFGEHLLSNKAKPVAIVESEKTAIIASVYLPQFIWLACGQLQGLTEAKCQVLKGRNVTLFPDLNGFEKWNIKAKELAHITSFTVSDLLESRASAIERQQGLDLADYLIRFYWKQFTEKRPKNVEKCAMHDEDNTAALQAFDEWFTLHPQGGIFEYEGRKIRITRKAAA